MLSVKLFLFIFVFLIPTGCTIEQAVVDTISQEPGLVFHHPGGVASDGEHVYLADRNNHRVLIWNSMPSASNDAPDLVLGQVSFTENFTGDGEAQMNWPTALATDGKRLIVADTYNDRLLIWKETPTEFGQAADLILDRGIRWPWGVWTDGEKLMVANTGAGNVLIWNHFPEENEAADFILKIKEFGTPRSVASDGSHLVVSDHNAKVADNANGANGPGTFFWNEFPTHSNEAYDFFTSSPQDGPYGEVLWSPVFTETGQFIALGQQSITIWDSFPTEESVRHPTTTVGNFRAGDSSGLAWTGEQLLVSLNNDNHLVIYEGIPNVNSEPIVELGVDPYWITNPVPVTDGEKLYVTSDFDHTLATWNTLPTDPFELPDEVERVAYPGWDNALWEGELYLAGGPNVSKWGTELLFQNKIGNAALQDLKGITMDREYFYLADKHSNAVFVWKGLPSVDENPFLVLEVPQPQRISSDGQYLAVVSLMPGGAIYIYKIADFASKNVPQVTIIRDRSPEIVMNLPSDVLVKDEKLFVANTVANSVLIWNHIEDALSGSAPDDTWGYSGSKPGNHEGELFWPGALDYHEGVLYLGEFKFSDRLLFKIFDE